MIKERPLIPFRAEAAIGAKLGVNMPIYFPDKTKGVIRSIIQIENINGKVFVIGKCRMI